MDENSDEDLSTATSSKAWTMAEALGLLDIHNTSTDNEDGQYATVLREFGKPRHRWYNHSVQSWVELFNTPGDTGTAMIAILVLMPENAMIGESDGIDDFDNKVLKMFNELRTTTTTTTPPVVTIPVRSDMTHVLSQLPTTTRATATARTQQTTQPELLVLRVPDTEIVSMTIRTKCQRTEMAGPQGLRDPGSASGQDATTMHSVLELSARHAAHWNHDSA